MGTANFPTLFPDETLYSWCGRFHELNGFGSVPRTSQALFGDPHAGRIHDFPGHLQEFARITGEVIGDAEWLQRRATLLPFFIPFLDERRAELLPQKLRDGRFSQAKMWLGLPASRLGGELPLKRCSECSRLDIHQYGVAYWHVAHQHPAALVCNVHGTPLEFALTNMAPVKARCWLTAERVAHWIDVPRGTNSEVLLLQRIASFANASRAMPGASLSPGRLRPTVESRLHELGLITDGGSVSQRSLAGAHKKYCDQMNHLFGSVRRFGLKLNLEKSFELVHSSRMRSIHPLKRLLILAVYFEDLEDLLAVQRLGPFEVSEPKKELRDGRRDAKSRFLELVESGSSIRAAAEQLKIAPNTGLQWASIAGRSVERRPKSITAEMRSEVRKQLIRGASKQQICRSTGIGIVSLNRAIGDDPVTAEQWRTVRGSRELSARRKKFARLLRDHPGLCLKKIRALPENGYHWHYRNDRKWLMDATASLLGKLQQRTRKK